MLEPYEESAAHEVEEKKSRQSEKLSDGVDNSYKKLRDMTSMKRADSGRCSEQDKGRRFLLPFGCNKKVYKMCECEIVECARCTECKFYKNLTEIKNWATVSVS